jgi:hypothetical protein
MSIFSTSVTRIKAPAYIRKIRTPGCAVGFDSGGLGDIHSNEILSRFAYGPRETKGIYLGIGSHQNFDHICKIKPQKSIIVDVSGDVADHLSAIKTLLKVTKSPFEFLAFAKRAMLIRDARNVPVRNDSDLLSAVSKHIFDISDPVKNEGFGSRVIAEKNLRYAEGSINDAEEFALLTEMLTKPEKRFLKDIFLYSFFNIWTGETSLKPYQNGWLFNMESFRYLRERVLNNDIAIIEGNIADKKVSKVIDQAISEAGPDVKKEIGAAYLSNVDKYVRWAGEHRQYIKNLKALPWADDALVIRTYSYVAAEKIDTWQHFRGFVDPFYYQVLEKPLACFFDHDRPTNSEKKLIKTFLMKEAMIQLLKLKDDFPEIKTYVDKNADKFFCCANANVAYLDIPALIAQFKKENSGNL